MADGTEIVENDQAPTLNERVAKGRLFSDYLDNPATAECFAVQETALIDGLKSSPRWEDARPYWERLRALLDVHLDAQMVVKDGERAQEEIDRQERYRDQGPSSAPIRRANTR